MTTKDKKQVEKWIRSNITAFLCFDNSEEIDMLVQYFYDEIDEFEEQEISEK